MMQGERLRAWNAQKKVGAKAMKVMKRPGTKCMKVMKVMKTSIFRKSKNQSKLHR